MTPRVLKDGSDSVGILGALNRVYLNIGLFSEEWLLHFRPLLGGETVTPIEISVAEKNLAYWQATETQTPDMALFFFASTPPHLLKDAPRRRCLYYKGQRQARSRQDCLRRALCPLPFKQASDACGRSRSEWVRRQRLSLLLEYLLGLDEDRRL